MSSNGSNPVNLTNHPADDQDPAWSPDGQWLTLPATAMAIGRSTPCARMAAVCGNLTRTLSNEYQPFWYSERQLLVANEKIAFTTDRDGNEEVYSMSIDGFNQTNLTNRPSNDFFPAVSPYGDGIAFVTNRDGNLEVYVMSTNGSNQFNLSVSPSQDTQPTWSPDSRWDGFHNGPHRKFGSLLDELERDRRQQLQGPTPCGGSLKPDISAPGDETFLPCLVDMTS